ncbi:bifunctional diguanylate cyclase/phosphodiesterase [Marinomonas phaeophyticola]
MDKLVNTLLLASKKKSNVGLLFLDLDNFKIINDTLGHKAGDELLCEVANRLISVSKESDIIARWGGDEFVIMMQEEVTDHQLKYRSQQVLDAMRKPVTLNNQSLTIPTSIGVSLSNNQEIDAEKLIQQADIAMYCAKDKGRDNAQFFTSSMANTVNTKFELDKEIKEALSSDQFYLVFQPKVFMTKDNILGLEALIRWQHPIKGFILPSDFIPVAEESRLIIKIDEWVITQALKQLFEWRQQGVDIVPVAINLSGRHLVSDSLVPFISEWLKFYNLEGHFLEIEITEGVLLHDIERCIEVMRDLKALNIQISVDDFGTGYSSLSYLKRLPLDVLKIDQSFVEECASHAEDAKICGTILNLAQNLDLTAVAEGVETSQQVDTLKSLGCQIFQGYYFYKPMPSEVITRLLSDSNIHAYHKP